METQAYWLSRNHEALFNQSNRTFNYLMQPPNRDRMGFGPGTPYGQWLDSEVTPKWMDFTAAFNDWLDPAQRTQNKTIKLTEAEEAFKPLYRVLYIGTLKENPLVTDDDLNSMGLPKHSSGERHPSKKADTPPDVDVDTSIIGRIIIHFFERASNHKKGKPAGQHGAEIRWAILDTPPTRWDELIHSEIDTNSPFTLVFENDMRGKTLYFALRWENTRGEKGPWSEIKSAIIP
jgi:hypothetical protein